MSEKGFQLLSLHLQPTGNVEIHFYLIISACTWTHRARLFQDSTRAVEFDYDGIWKYSDCIRNWGLGSTIGFYLIWLIYGHFDAHCLLADYPILYNPSRWSAEMLERSIRWICSLLTSCQNLEVKMYLALNKGQVFCGNRGMLRSKVRYFVWVLAKDVGIRKEAPDLRSGLKGWSTYGSAGPCRLYLWLLFHSVSRPVQHFLWKIYSDLPSWQKFLKILACLNNLLFISESNVKAFLAVSGHSRKFIT